MEANQPKPPRTLPMSAGDNKSLVHRYIEEVRNRNSATLDEFFRKLSTPFFGGCCGADTTHIECLAIAYKAWLQ